MLPGECGDPGVEVRVAVPKEGDGGGVEDRPCARDEYGWIVG